MSAYVDLNGQIDKNSYQFLSSVHICSVRFEFHEKVAQLVKKKKKISLQYLFPWMNYIKIKDSEMLTYAFSAAYICMSSNRNGTDTLDKENDFSLCVLE